jgi:hypothetical protein
MAKKDTRRRQIPLARVARDGFFIISHGIPKKWPRQHLSGAAS